MEKFEALLKKMDLSFLPSGEASIKLEKAIEMVGRSDTCFLDVRTNEETEYVKFPFALHIPINEIPDRINEIPKDKNVLIFCVMSARAAITYAYLRQRGFEKARFVPARIGEIAAGFDPGFVLTKKNG
jgi:rhodanese-related sulfurtransferase